MEIATECEDFLPSILRIGRITSSPEALEDAVSTLNSISFSNAGLHVGYEFPCVFTDGAFICFACRLASAKMLTAADAVNQLIQILSSWHKINKSLAVAPTADTAESGSSREPFVPSVVSEQIIELILRLLDHRVGSSTGRDMDSSVAPVKYRQNLSILAHLFSVERTMYKFKVGKKVGSIAVFVCVECVVWVCRELLVVLFFVK